jgi:DNA-binding LytR/AlgR family response regulator
MIDIVLPNMNGFELYWRINRLDDKAKICFITASELYYEEIRKETMLPKITELWLPRIIPTPATVKNKIRVRI